MDDAEDAAQRQDFYLDLALGKQLTKNGLVRKPVVINLSNPSQECFQCGGWTESDKHRWCSAECRRDWEKDNE